MQTLEKSYYSTQEYLELEVASEERHEYIDGQIIAMTGRLPNHNQIAGNLYSALNFALRFYKSKENQWIFCDYNSPEEILSLSALDFEISLLDIYDKVDFNIDETND
jgi:Uma2 family endonuclease